MNIASMLGAIPLSGLPLIFFSHGGTALLSALSAVGIAFNVSRFKKINS
jgi:cell division protein FtsW (lipid II flippase)